jgi:hypothetical protein
MIAGPDTLFRNGIYPCLQVRLYRGFVSSAYEATRQGKEGTEYRKMEIMQKWTTYTTGFQTPVPLPTIWTLEVARLKLFESKEELFRAACPSGSHERWVSSVPVPRNAKEAAIPSIQEPFWQRG